MLRFIGNNTVFAPHRLVTFTALPFRVPDAYHLLPGGMYVAWSEMRTLPGFADLPGGTVKCFRRASLFLYFAE